MNFTREYPWGIDCTWLGTDKKGALAAFITSGFGDIPRSVLSNVNVDILDIEELLMLLPNNGRGRMIVDIPRPDDFIALANRGLYVYDWRNTAYALAASPDNEATVTNMSNDMQTLVEPVKLNNATFSTSPTIALDEHIPSSSIIRAS